MNSIGGGCGEEGEDEEDGGEEDGWCDCGGPRHHYWEWCCKIFWVGFAVVLAGGFFFRWRQGHLMDDGCHNG